jgi:hypothetical protein
MSIFITDGKGKPIDNAQSQSWYHGSPVLLEVLATGGSITRNRGLAIAFSHKPTQIGVSDDGTISHNGKQNGYLYEIAEPVSWEDIHPHPKVKAIAPDDLWEWLTTRPFRLKLIQKTIP